MAATSPMAFLRDMAEQTLTDTTAELGKVQQVYTLATEQLRQLENFALEYQQQLHSTVSGKGIPMAELLNRQSFIDSLGKVVRQHTGHVARCKEAVDEKLETWRQDKKRLNAFETLQSRSEAVRMQKEQRLEQKAMDEFAQRASTRKKIL
ncbi:flagella biosynthesis chaperone FliJ [Pluralibacter gergoviae]|uniref:Flagellar FliJ protein n=1 Tax=Pluralibacter gergoviae TaxID=61647 RepID=A0A089PLN3_PLUGE|nr:flagellar export protein FliJ [Pluralibacter gergoviae]AVR02554.1 flagella biosynthesis chaperone FliJ [Pluralibacter gergoviae]EKT9640877.1 flagella biosynthesis chaperone FliJ [Pluralibacter gergoviae]EKV0916186.1 flagella biosynthesis chaperone FliJ [Pluralibacter gergoviae]EKV0931940.1 flagella biosynthesis chaperone FliJ [Pluralibacter gergoviae]EKV3541509.1 flagella biosynthesis chaperone FliJ [Pluralibacter gergoviae]